MKPTRPRYWLFILDGVVLVGAAVLIFFALHSGQDSNKDCHRPGQTHQLSLSHDSFPSPALTVDRCDILQVTNNDTQDYALAFGHHDHHISYPGFTFTTLRPGKTLTFNVTQTGAYEVHDHIRDHAEMQLTIR